MTNTSTQPKGPVGAIQRVLGAVALAALIRTLFYTAVDAFSDHLFGDPRPERSGTGQVVSPPWPHATEDHRRIDVQNRPLPRSQVA